MPTKGYKTTIGYTDQGSNGALGTGSFTNFAKVTDINGVSVEAEDIETSNMDSPVGSDGKPWKEYTAGWASAGDVDLKLQFDKTDAGAVYGLFRADKTFQVTFVDGSTWTFNGYMKKHGQEVEREKLVTTTVTFKISGEPEFQPAN